MRREFGDRVNVRIIYTQENHAGDKTVPSLGDVGTFTIARNVSERRVNACRAVDLAKLTAPILLDTVDDQAARAYDASSARMYVLDAAGRIAFRGEKPFVSVDSGAKVVRRLLSAKTQGRRAVEMSTRYHARDAKS